MLYSPMMKTETNFPRDIGLKSRSIKENKSGTVEET
jgi:hypothetical protein